MIEAEAKVKIELLNNDTQKIIRMLILPNSRFTNSKGIGISKEDAIYNAILFSQMENRRELINYLAKIIDSEAQEIISNP